MCLFWTKELIIVNSIWNSKTTYISTWRPFKWNRACCTKKYQWTECCHFLSCSKAVFVCSTSSGGWQDASRKQWSVCCHFLSCSKAVFVCSTSSGDWKDASGKQWTECCHFLSYSKTGFVCSTSSGDWRDVSGKTVNRMLPLSVL